MPASGYNYNNKMTNKNVVNIARNIPNGESRNYFMRMFGQKQMQVQMQVQKQVQKQQQGPLTQNLPQTGKFKVTHVRAMPGDHWMTRMLGNVSTVILLEKKT